MAKLVSGVRPTGKLHLGHYFGVIQNWLELQNRSDYECFFFIADYHCLTTKFLDTDDIRQDTVEVAKDFLSCGVNPEKMLLFVQSAVPSIGELHILLSMITPQTWVERDPTLKDLVRALGEGHEADLSYGMLGYPVLQTADILTFLGELVPVGKDQVAHLEMSRDIARRFNNLFQTDLLPEPKALLTESSALKGIDGGKMSKSFHNDIKIADTPEQTLAQVKKMVTDIERIKRSDPGSTARCQVPFPYYKILADQKVLNEVKAECESARQGCVDCKVQLASLINEFFAPIRERREKLKDHEVLEILHSGNQKAQAIAHSNLKKIRAVMKFNDFRVE
ncbi:MAG: tryptophan--tRNA ligase [Candidatus Caenarcaniphilales bacterium]|nr:tryptophan--tRNA ligase [Candidatus Caenarcaniphilales bacterium]